MLWFCLSLTLGLVNSLNFNVTEKIGNDKSNPCTDKNHIFLAPGVLTAGGMNRACVSRFFTDGRARMELSLLTEDRQTVKAFRELPPGDGGCLDINVPQLPNTKADLIVNIRYPEAQCVWERRLLLRISSGRVVVLSTERARYRPGEMVRLRILVLKQDLAPSHGLIEEVWLEGPHGAWEGSRVTEWSRVRTRLGLAQLQYQLDELAPTGKWTLRARLGDGSQGSTVFTVGNYELPPFQLSVRHAPRVLRTSDRLVWTVCVRYPWSEAVEGMLVIRLRGAGGGSGGIRTAVQLRSPKACHRHAAAAKRLGLDGADPPDVVVADFAFQEEGTRIWQNTTVVSQVVDKPISLEFLTKHRAVISPGLPYKLKVKATRWDDKSATNELVRVCRYPSNSPGDVAQASATRDNNKCAEGATDASGVARLLFAAGDDAAPFYTFEAQLSNDSTTTAAPLTLPVRRSSTVHAALGPLKADSRQSRTFVPLYLNTNITIPYTVHFVVITRGGIIYRWGATTQCPTSNSGDQIHTTPRNSKCNSNNNHRDVIMAQRDNVASYDDIPQKYRSTNYNDRKIPFGSANLPQRYKHVLRSTGTLDVLLAQKETSSNGTSDISDALLDRHQLRVMLPIKVTHQMCPDSHLIAYFYHDGELVSASKHFEMDECFVNKVEATWLTRQTQPGSTVSLQISTPGPALCALTVLDTAAKWTQPPESAKEQLLGGLRRLIDSHRNLTEYDTAGVCFLNTDTPEIPSTSIELTSSWLAAAGVRLLGGEAPTVKQCNARPPALLVADEATVPRSDFSEAWLWRLLPVGANGTGVASARTPDSITRFEAGAVCVSKNGAAISPPAVLQVFREFFIHADSPKRLRRGDSTIIRYRIFNYLYEPLSVQIQILTDPHVQGPKDPVESACVRARSSIARRAEVRTRVAAPARIRIRAKAVSDGNCGNITSGKTGVSDEVIIRIAVDPEGVPVREQKSILLCGNSTEYSTSEVKWNWPPVEAVAGTETLTVWAVGDVTGPLLADSDSLILIPRGCGEQNMAQLATNLLALQELEPTSIAALTAREHVARGFTRQLQYVHPSGGFSAFGPSDATSSTWLTAFVIRHLRRAHQLLWPNIQVPPAIIRAERWLLSQQMENGCFRNEGQVFHRELRGGLNDEGEIASVALTAYVITSIIESASPLPYRVIRNTLSCLRAFPALKSKTPTKVYAHALLAYAYMKLEGYEEDLRTTNEASNLLRRHVVGMGQDEGVKQVQELLKVARRSGDYVWWEANSLSTSIEATAYALLALRASPRVLRSTGATGDAARASRWLAAHRGTSGGFVSTQDTLVALEALTAWSVHAPGTHLNVTARCSGLDSRVTLLPGVKVPDVMKMRPGDKLSVSVEGTGCALVQATRAYNTLASDVKTEEKQLSVQVAVHTDGPFDCVANGTSCFCAAVIEACVMWSGSFPEMALLEVTLPGGFGADAQLLYSQLNKPTLLLRRIELTPTSTRATFYLGTRDGSDTSGHAGHQCYNIHATGPRTKTRPAYARVQDYYAPSINDTQVYTIPEECPPRITHETNEYRSSDNLFTKARALDTDEIVITHEFSFEDIPEGIPLEDPLYDNWNEYEKYTIGSHLEVGRLEKHNEDSQIYAYDIKDNNSSENVEAQNISTYKVLEKDQSNFEHIADRNIADENVADRNASTNERTIKEQSHLGDIVVENVTVNDRTQKDRSNFDNIVANVITFEGRENNQSHFENIVANLKTFAVTENNKSNFDNILANVNTFEATENNQSSFDSIVGNVKKFDNTENNRSNFDSTESNTRSFEGTENDSPHFDNIVGSVTAYVEGAETNQSNFGNIVSSFGTFGGTENYHNNFGKFKGGIIGPNNDTQIHQSNSDIDLGANLRTNEGSKHHINFDEDVGTNTKAVVGFKNDHINWDNGVAKNIEINEGTIKIHSNFHSVVDGNVKANEGTVSDHRYFDSNAVGTIKANQGTVNHRYFQTGANGNIMTNLSTVEDLRHSENSPGGNVLANKSTAKDHSNFDNFVGGNFKANKDTLKIYSNLNNIVGGNNEANKGTEKDNSNFKEDVGVNLKEKADILINVHSNTDHILPLIPIEINDSTEKDHSNFDDVLDELIKTNEKAEREDVKNNNEESPYDTRNNLVQEIDGLNEVAHQQLNITQSKYDVHHNDYRHMYSPSIQDKVLILNNNNPYSDNTVDNYNVNDEYKSRDEIKRSYKVEQSSSPQLSEKIISKPDTDSKTDDYKGVDNPLLAEFHVIDSEKDLEVPSGVEGPIPTIVRPPPNFVPPPTTSVDSRRLQYRHLANRQSFDGPVPDIVLPPQYYVPPPISRMERVPSNVDLSLDLGGPVSDIILPRFDFAPPIYNNNFRSTHNGYSPVYVPPLNVQGPIGKVLSQPNFVPAENTRNLQSIYTPNGPYFYFKPESDNSRLDKSYFIPVR